MVGAADPFQLFRIMYEVRRGAARPGDRGGVHARPVPQHRAEDPGQIRSVMNVQEATAKALLVDRDALAERPGAGDVLGANAVFMDAYNTDVRPLLAELRAELGLDPTRWPPTPVRVLRAGSRRARRRRASRLGSLMTARRWTPTRRPPSTS